MPAGQAMKPMLNGTGTLWGYRNEATEDVEQFLDCFLFFVAGHQREERFFSDFVRMRPQVPPPTVSAGKVEQL